MYNFDIIGYVDQIILYMLIPGLDLIRLFIIRIFKNKTLSSDRNHIHHLLLRKYSLEKSLIILLLMIIFPIILIF